MAHQDNFDHRSNDSDAQDPTSMTIEFLRARLLAERAVSKNARAKLDELAAKVADLEEQLKIVSLQRKKAEQATVDVLAILEENGFTDVSDTYDSNSDDESYSQTNSVSGKHISWKGRRKEPNSSGNLKESRTRRQRNFESNYLSSPRHRQGKSCRQIRRSESRAVAENYKRDGNPIDFQGNRVSSDMLPKTSGEASTTMTDVTVIKGNKSLQELPNSNNLEKVNNMDINLEKALENRAQVIGSYEDMEQTQREWEKKFREDKSSALDLSDVGNHSDVTDDSNGQKTQAQLQAATVVPSVSDTRSLTNEVNFRESFQTLSDGSPDDCRKSCSSKSVDHDDSPSGDKGKHISNSPGSECLPPKISNRGFFEQASSTTHESPPVTRPNSRAGSFCSSAATIQRATGSLIPAAEYSDSCDSVLTALKQAKLSLQEKFSNPHDRKPESLSESSYQSVPGSYMNTYALPTEPTFDTKSSLSASSVGCMVEVPVGCAGLFRVPTDVSVRENYLSSVSQKALVSHIPDLDIHLLPGDQLLTKTPTKNLLSSGFQSHLLNISAPLSSDGRPSTTPYISGPQLWAGFRPDGRPVVEAQESRLYKGTTSVSDSPISGGSSPFQGNQTTLTSFKLDRQASTYTGNLSYQLPLTISRPLYPDPILLTTQMYSTPYYSCSVGLSPKDGSDDSFRRVGS